MHIFALQLHLPSLKGRLRRQPQRKRQLKIPFRIASAGSPVRALVVVITSALNAADRGLSPRHSMLYLAFTRLLS